MNDIELYKKLLSELKIENESEVFETLKEILDNMEDLDRKDIQELFEMLIKKIELTSLSPITYFINYNFSSEKSDILVVPRYILFILQKIKEVTKPLYISKKVIYIYKGATNSLLCE